MGGDDGDEARLEVLIDAVLDRWSAWLGKTDATTRAAYRRALLMIGTAHPDVAATLRRLRPRAAKARSEEVSVEGEGEKRAHEDGARAAITRRRRPT
jgi:hypothetical protein